MLYREEMRGVDFYGKEAKRFLRMLAFARTPREESNSLWRAKKAAKMAWHCALKIAEKEGW